MCKFTVIGSLNMDLVINSPKTPVLGETILGYDYMTVPGGKGANQAIAIARLGGQVSMIGCVGDDYFGRELLNNLSVNNVNIQNVKINNTYSTGIAFITVINGNNFIIVDSGANFCLIPEEVDGLCDIIKQSDMILIQLEIPMQMVERVIDIAKSNNVKVLLNPAPARKLSDELLSKIDIITPNESECEIITGLSVENIQDAKAAVTCLNKKGIPNVIVTLGSKGIVYNDNREIIHKPVRNVKALDTTAAGDSFSGALAFAITKAKSIDEATDFANAAATLTVTKKGAQSSLPYIAEVMAAYKGI